MNFVIFAYHNKSHKFTIDLNEDFCAIHWTSLRECKATYPSVNKVSDDVLDKNLK